MMRSKKLIQSVAVAGLFSLGLGTVAAGCLNRPLDRVDPRTTSTVIERLQQNGVDKIDLLLAIDNSISMGDKQEILADAVPVLVKRLVEPRCVDEAGDPTGVNVDANGDCPAGSKSEFPPIRDINVGLISSSLGDLTSGACTGATVVHPDDKARLLSRGVTAAETYKGLGFLAWDPDNKRGGSTDPDAIITTLGEMVVGVDQVGCGYEMQLESILRFLVDPAPYESLQVESSKLKKVGVDQVLLDQRKDFLRPDSLVAVLILSDENDCSVDVSQQGFLALKGPFFKATSECATDPNDPCCSSCGLPVESGCDAGNSCGTPKYSAAQDHPNLKCFNQKQRYGVNFLYPVQRYINALTQTKINPSRRDYDGTEDPSKSVANPLYSDLAGTGGTIRSPDLVFVAGIVGVPWQAISRRDDAGNPDLKLGFKTFSELQDDLDALVGDPDTAKPPTDPFMIEDFNKRTGTSTILNASLPGMNPINGNDYTIPTTEPDNLQYACIFPLKTPVPASLDCGDCTDASCDNPLCNNTVQESAKAYPGLRELALLRGLGTQAIFASICPAIATGDPTQDDYGYNPAVNTIIDRLKEELGGQCLPRKLTPDAEGNVPCLVIEASKVDGACDCSEGIGRKPIPETIDGQDNPTYNAVKAAQSDEFADDWNCFCEINQIAAGDERDACLTNGDANAAAQGDGWCYIDGASVPPVGDPELVATCPANERRLMRFVGKGEARAGSTLFITCSGE